MDKKNELISIIVPVYNVAEYLDECVNSIVNQTYQNLEIILVNDGSTDNSGKKCEEWAKKDSRIKVINKSNGGLSDARNKGLEIAKGDFIGFVDSDDWIDPQMYKKLYTCIKENQLDIAVCDFQQSHRFGFEIVDGNNQLNIFSGIKAADMLFSHEPIYISYSVWKCLYKRSVISNLRFPFGLLYEDVFYNLQAFWNAGMVGILNEKLYYYRIREDSIMGVKLSDKHITSMCEYAMNVLDFYEKNGNKIQNRIARKSMIYDLLTYRHLLIKESGKKNCIEKVSKIDKFLKERKLSAIDTLSSPKMAVRYFIYRYMS